MTTTEIIIHKS